MMIFPKPAPEARNVNNRRWSAYSRRTGGTRLPLSTAPAGAELPLCMLLFSRPCRGDMRETVTDGGQLTP